ncbi:WG repeat-containing protein [Psychrobacter jeotgali]|uniref:WG repeat-containing protein n=1 Tax=Psychrobacter jeotgali TaxID=179010 RepID=UPI00191918B9|nr:WG repeat-containing protein [Psychrobacter jeotgali]
MFKSKEILFALFTILFCQNAQAAEECFKPSIEGIVETDVFCAIDTINLYRSDSEKSPSEKYVTFRKDKLYGIADIKGKVIVPPIYQEVGEQGFVDEVIPVKRQNKWGYVNILGSEFIPTRYDYVSYFFNDYGLAVADDEGKTGCIDINGIAVIPIIYDANSSCEFDEGYDVGVDKKWLEVGIEHDDKNNYHFGCVDRENNIIVPLRYLASICNFGKELRQDSPDFQGKYSMAIDMKTQKRGLIDKTGKFVFPVIYDSITEIDPDWYLVSVNDKYGYIDEQRKVLIPFKFDNAFGFYDNLARVFVEEGIGYIDRQGDYVIEPKPYTAASDFEYGLAIVSNGEWLTSSWKSGLIDKQGRLLLPIIYDYIRILGANEVEVKKDGVISIINNL